MHRDRFLSFVVADVLHADVVLYAVIGDFPAMERERATRGTNRGSPRGIPRKTRSHQDSWMLALCCTDLTYWPLQLPCTINRDPARSASYTKRKGGRGGGGGRERKKKHKEKIQEGRRDVASHVVVTLNDLPFFFFLLLLFHTHRFRGWGWVSSSRFDLAYWKRPTVKMENRLGLRRWKKRRRDLARAISRRRTHYAHLTSCALPKNDVYKHATYCADADARQSCRFDLCYWLVEIIFSLTGMKFRYMR